MDTYFVKEIDLVTFCIDPEKNHIFYLTEQGKNDKQYIIEEDLLSFSVVNKFDVLQDPEKTSDTYGYNLYHYKKKNYLVLTYPSSLITIWDVNTRALIFKVYAWRKAPNRITALMFSESYPMFAFAVRDQPRLFINNINEIVQESNFGTRKLKLPKKVTINDLKAHPVASKCVGACSDGLIRVWDLSSFSLLQPIFEPIQGIDPKKLAQLKITDFSKLNLSSVNCLSFSTDGKKLLSCNQYGKVICWDVTNLGEEFQILSSIRISELGVLSVTWLNYNGNYRSSHIVGYTQEGNIKLLELEQHSEKRPDKKGITYSFKEVENIFHVKSHIDISKVDIQPNYSSFLKSHAHCNTICINTVKEKKIMKKKEIFSKFSLNAKILMVYNKFDYLMDYPKIAPTISLPLEQILFAENSKQLTYNKDMFYIEDTSLNYLNLATGRKEHIIDFIKTPQLSDIIRTTNFQVRPIGIKNSPVTRMLINFQKELHHVLLLATLNMESDPLQLKLLKEMPCSVSLFLGDQNLHNPPIFILGEDRQTYIVLIDEPSKLDAVTKSTINVDARVRDMLDMKIRNIFTTPFRNGYVILYHTYHDNTLRFSRNKISSNEILDFKILTSDHVFKTQYDENIFDVVWQAKSEYIKDDKYLGVIVCWNNLILINHNLETLTSVRIPHFNIRTNMLIKAFWMGNTVFYYTKNHLFYSTIDGKSNCVLSFDNYSNKNQIISVLNDRIILGSKPIIRNSKQAIQPKYKMEVRFREISLIEPIVLGYLSLRKKQILNDINFKILRQNIVLLDSHNISKEMIQGLVDQKLYNAAWYFLSNDTNIQFSLNEKVEVQNYMKTFEEFFETLFPNKKLDDEINLNDLIIELTNNPELYIEKTILNDQIEKFINFGEYKKALKCLDLLQNYKMISDILGGLNEKYTLNQISNKFLKMKENKILDLNLKMILYVQGNQKLKLSELRNSIKEDSFSEKINFKIDNKSSFGLFSQDIGIQEYNLKEKISSSFNFRDRKEKLEQIKNKLFAFEDSSTKISKPTLAFGESAYNIIFPKSSKDSEEDPPGQFSKILSSNTYQSLGYDSLEAADSKIIRKYGMSGNDQEEENKEENELGALSIYLRFDEGKGLSLENLVNPNLSAVVEFKGVTSPPEHFWLPIEDGDPVELEDKWGKRCPPQFALSLKQDLTNIKLQKKSWFTGPVINFSVELWIKPKSSAGTIIEIGNNFSLSFQNLEILLTIRGNNINLSQENKEQYEKEDEADEDYNKDEGRDEENNKIKLNTWNHLAFIYDNSNSKKIMIYLNCLLIASSEFSIPLDNFKDQQFCIGQEKLNADITELRWWNKSLNSGEIKEQYRTPLEIVYEKKKEIKMKLKMPNKNKDNSLAPLPNKQMFASAKLSAPGESSLKQPGLANPMSFSTISEPTHHSKPIESDFRTTPIGLKPPSNFAKEENDFMSFNSVSIQKPKEFTDDWSSQPAKKDQIESFSDFSQHNSNSIKESKSNFNFGFTEEKPDIKNETKSKSEFNSFDNFNTVSSSKFSTFEEFGTTSTFSVENTEKKSAPKDSFDTWGGFSDAKPSEKPKTIASFDFGDDFGKSATKPVASTFETSFSTFEESKKVEPKKGKEFDSFDGFSTNIQEEGKKVSSFSNFDNFGKDIGLKSASSEENFNIRYSISVAHPDLSINQSIPSSTDITFSSPDNDNKLEIYDEDNKNIKESYIESIFSNLSKIKSIESSVIINEIKDTWSKLVEAFLAKNLAQTSSYIGFILDALIEKMCSEISKGSNSRDDLKIIQKIIQIISKYRLAIQLLNGIEDLKSKKAPNNKKITFLYNVLWSLKLRNEKNPVYLIEIAQNNLKAKNFKLAGFFYENILIDDSIELSSEERENIIQILSDLKEMPMENQSLVKLVCPYCQESFAYQGENECSECIKELSICYQTLSCIDELSNLKCNACLSTFSKSAKSEKEKCTVCKIGLLCSK